MSAENTKATDCKHCGHSPSMHSARDFGGPWLCDAIDCSCTGYAIRRVVGRPFEKGDDRINRGGRPKGHGEMRELARDFTEHALARLVDMLHSPEGATVVKAAVAILDRGWGKPAVAITGPDGGPVQASIDLSKLSVEQLEQLKSIMRAAKGG